MLRPLRYVGVPLSLKVLHVYFVLPVIVQEWPNVFSVASLDVPKQHQNKVVG